MKIIQSVLGSILLFGLFATASLAQNGRSFVSGAGLDTNPCSLTSPCRTIQQAITVTNSGGEVVVLDSAGYGPFTAFKAVTVEAAPGVYAGITVPSGVNENGISVNGGPNDVIILRGLAVNYQGSGFVNGIAFNSGNALHIENCIATGFSNGAGINVPFPGNIFVKDTICRNNQIGLDVDLTAAGAVALTMDQVRLDDNTELGADLVAAASGAVVLADMDHVYMDGNGGSGLQAEAMTSGAAVHVAMRNGSASSNTNNSAGLFVSGTGGVASLDIESFLLANNSNVGVAVQGVSSGAATASISNCTISHNLGAFSQQSGGTIFTRGQNTFIGNGASSGNLTALTGQ
jgi:hypothetical protein